MRIVILFLLLGGLGISYYALFNQAFAANHMESLGIIFVSSIALAGFRTMKKGQKTEGSLYIGVSILLFSLVVIGLFS
ncbi:hypothetical protein H0266_13940 [Halobacillus locisalis]|uniref:DUF3953 domain-containing protein n=1 Tax=Halobacillus locisalis TaxID=220753 RepID=A0A838CVP9_9BACI|nr:hypothetical protein [Halobacillus locisalis]MBA2175993.1 hypothetical protein [Halobacillus locisalis]